jgi:inosine/xanthosine triphosphatase
MSENITRVLVASQNHVKAAATENAFTRLGYPKLEVEMAPDKVDSGVGRQPVSFEETMQGALNRLEIARNLGRFSFYAAIESGVHTIGGKWFEAACAAVANDHSDQPFVGFGRLFLLPPHFSRHIEEGKSLNQAMLAETGIEKAGEEGGFVGWFTDGAIDRAEASSHAVEQALYAMHKSTGWSSEHA